MSEDLLLEIGTEEIPAHYMPSVLSQIKELAQKKFDEANIAYEDIRSIGTPRRVALLMKGVAEKQADVSSKNKGPSVAIAFDQAGKPTKAAMGFARGQKIAVENLIVEDGYVYAQVTSLGVATKELLPDMLKNMVLALSFPKSMIWGNEDVRFVRPIRWFVALYGSEVVPFEIAHVQSGNQSRGHRFLSQGEFTIPSMADYEAVMEEHFVIADPVKRRQMILTGLKKLADEQNGTIIMDEDLLEEVIYLVEYPTPLCGKFDEKFLQLPEAAIITPMKDHQRYFPIRDKSGKLMNLFLTVRNGGAEHLETVQHGNERVLRARLDDAKFFFEEDKKKKLGDRIEDLKKIVFQDGLGTLRDKATRLSGITLFLKQELNLSELDDSRLERAALLAKTDLLTQMVSEFTELQGVMGKEYALIDNEGNDVAEAIFEQYLPRFAGDILPSTVMGKVLGIADKFDTITGSFSQGLIPTGSQDPFALRRQTIGILNILIEAQWSLDCNKVFALILNQLHVEKTAQGKIIEQLDEYFRLRLKNILQDKGVDYRIIDCVLDGGCLDAAMAVHKAQALISADVMGQGELLQAFTRVGNMVKDAVVTVVDPALFETEEEKALYCACQAMAPQLPALYESYDYAGVVQVLSEGIAVINAFLDNVLVMHDDEDVKNNRVHLLTLTFSLISPLGDIKKLS